MKLLLCPDCWDVFKLTRDKLRSCECGRVVGKYLDNTYAVSNGRGVSIGLDNRALHTGMYALDDLREPMSREAMMAPHSPTLVRCWIRPNSGVGNPHMRVDPTLTMEKTHEPRQSRPHRKRAPKAISQVESVRPELSVRGLVPVVPPEPADSNPARAEQETE